MEVSQSRGSTVHAILFKQTEPLKKKEFHPLSIVDT